MSARQDPTRQSNFVECALLGLAIVVGLTWAAHRHQPAEADPGLRFKDRPAVGTIEFEAWAVQKSLPSDTPIPPYLRADADRAQPGVRSAIHDTYEGVLKTTRKTDR